MLRLLTATAAILFLGALPTVAQEQATECHVGSDYVVLGTQVEDRVGNSFTAVPRSAGLENCESIVPGGELSFRVDDSEERFLALEGRYLVLSIDAHPYHLVAIHDLSGKAEELVMEAREITLTQAGVSYFELGDVQATPETCPTYAELTADGMGAYMGEARFFDYATGTVTPRAELRCYQTP